MTSVIIATENTGKFEEIRAFLTNEFASFFSLRDFEEKVIVDEDSMLYTENAMKKARKIGERFGMCTIADDSGLEVEALGGRPGAYSSRYGKDDDERITKLLSELQEVPWERRGAIFRAYLVFYIPEKERGYLFYGHLKGYIGFEKKGIHGFGFDPVFYVPELKRNLAELTTMKKNAISHRGRALSSLKKFLHGDPQLFTASTV